jgi:hypothetical protein
MSNLTSTIPPRLREDTERYVRAGWHRDLDGLVADALRQYLDSHSEDLMEQFTKKDLEWGLRGSD